MADRTWALIDAAGLVENVISWDGTTQWSPPDGFLCIEVTGTEVGPGWTYVDGIFYPPVEPEPVPVLTES